MKFIEGPFVFAHVVFGAPGLRDHHHHGVGQGTAGHHQQFQGIIEDGRIAARLDQDRFDFFQVGAQDRRLHPGFAAAHAVDVAAEGIDLAVVGQHAKRLGQRPGRQGIGAVALMGDGIGGGEGFFAQVGKHRHQLAAGQHPFVHDGMAGEAGQVILAVIGIGPVGRFFFGQPADDI
ncbi:MAG: hypothetical protein BWY71_01024 [Planctomycetes bacterium ADurb.Bin412]|nr:MAG: hypothetical protein BWY71_01024 [Planctomycetes bacterium ADurb.Bin412]